MKKLFLTTLLVTLGLLTGCGNKEIDEVKTDMETVYDKAIETAEGIVVEYEDLHWTEEEFEEAKIDTIAYVEAHYVEEGICEDCKNEIIEVINSLEYNPKYTRGYDYEAFVKEVVLICADYGMLPEEYNQYTIDELVDYIIYQ